MQTSPKTSAYHPDDKEVSQPCQSSYICWTMQHFHAWWDYVSQK